MNNNGGEKQFVAIDVGASPGGWTKALADNGVKVYAIDPAVLDPLVIALPDVIHVKKMGEAAVEDLKVAKCMADLIVCDINQPPYRVASVLLQMMEFLKPGGSILMTMKFNGKGREHEGQVEGVEKIFGKAIDEKETNCVWLMSNTNRERTLLLKKKVEPEPEPKRKPEI